MGRNLAETQRYSSSQPSGWTAVHYVNNFLRRRDALLWNSGYVDNCSRLTAIAMGRNRQYSMENNLAGLFLGKGFVGLFV